MILSWLFSLLLLYPFQYRHLNLQILLKGVNNWNDFKNVLEAKSKLEKGKAFEELTKYYLLYNPVYKSKLKNVWLQREISPTILKKFNTPSNGHLIKFSSVSNHISTSITRRYLGISKKEIKDIYQSFDELM